MCNESPRRIKNFDFDWRFDLGDTTDAQAPDYDDSHWRLLSLPHDWSIEGEYSRDNPTGTQCGFLPTGIGWYRKELVMPEDIQSTRTEILFDGIYMNSEVWCNGHYLGTRPYGYISIHYDLTDHLHPGGNVIAVRVDNSLEPSSRWYNGAGIYGHVQLVQTGAVHIPTCGTYVTTPTITNEAATVRIETTVQCHGIDAQVTVDSVILDASGKTVAESSSQCQVVRESTQRVVQETTIAAPLLWSPDSPNLYELRTRVLDREEILDEASTIFGVRHIECNATQGFLLNGVQTKLKGVCNHHDAGPVGAAVPDKVLERRIQILKDMGCNAIRTAHNPFTPAFYAICDRLGMMVMDEIFDGWHGKGEYDYASQAFDEWWQQDVRDWVVRDRNHACVVMWSIGNETGTHDTHNITGLIKQFDTTRPITGGDVHHGVDVTGFNGKAGCPDFLETFKADHPDQPIVLTEVPHTYQTRGFYRVLNWWRDINRPRHEIPSLGDKQIFFDGHVKYSSSYDNSGIRISSRTSWKRTKELDWLIGEFRWTGFDYIGETFPGSGWPLRFWSHGIIDLCGFPKDHYYLYQSFWTDTPMVHVLPHWTHPGLDGTEIPVIAYSNCEEVELFLNGRSLGLCQRGDLLDFQWRVAYEPGELKAVAFRNGEAVAETLQRTASDPIEIRLESDNTSLIPDKTDIAHLTITAHDTNGTLVPRANDPIHFEFSGPVRHLGFENGNHTDLMRHRIKHRNLFHGMALGIFQATADDGPIEITAAGILGDPLFSEATSVAIAVDRISLRGDLVTAELGIHYTTDGSEPTPSSPLYDSPIMLAESTTVRALVIRDGRPFMSFDRDFVKGEKEPVVDPRLLLPSGESSVQVDGFVGPFAEQIVGTWILWRRRLQFKPDGTILQSIGDGEATLAAYWWYDYPLDVFENPDDTGTGQIRWLNTGEVYQLKLMSLEDPNTLTLPDSTHLADLTRV